MSKPGMPYANDPIAKYLSARIDALQGIKNQREIAFEIGYLKPNMISMFKRGEAKIPIDKVMPLAKALMVDPKHLLQLYFHQYDPKIANVIGEINGLGGLFSLSNNEVRLIELHRNATNNSDPCIADDLEAQLIEAYRAFLTRSEAVVGD